MEKRKVLFVCVHNSARSQMAESFLNRIAGDIFTAESAGLEPGRLNPVVVEVMREVGIDISKNRTNSVHEFFREGRSYDYVITVCDESSAKSCPRFPGKPVAFHWSLTDPSRLTGTAEEIKKKLRAVRDQIRTKITQWVANQVEDLSG